MSVLVIAECGVNANGDLGIAKDMIHAAKEAGADIAKFQLFKDRPAIEHLRFSEEQMLALHDECERTGIEFACTPFYLEAVAFLNPLVKRHKIASGWMKNEEIINAAIATGKPVIASLGMADPNNDFMLYIPNLSYLHCVSLYPCPDEKANLTALTFVNGYSDHTTGITACIAAAALGAQIIEKHFTFDKTQPGPDHSCSAEPEEFAEMVRHIRRIERML